MTASRALARLAHTLSKVGTGTVSLYRAFRSRVGVGVTGRGGASAMRPGFSRKGERKKNQPTLPAPRRPWRPGRCPGTARPPPDACADRLPGIWCRADGRAGRVGAGRKGGSSDILSSSDAAPTPSPPPRKKAARTPGALNHSPTPPPLLPPSQAAPSTTKAALSPATKAASTSSAPAAPAAGKAGAVARAPAGWVEQPKKAAAVGTAHPARADGFQRLFF